MYLLALVRSGRPWRRFTIALILLLSSIILFTFIPELVAPLVLLALLLLLWERAHIGYTLRDLTRSIASGNLDTKLEVQEDDFGALCHAVNNLLQQQRLQQRTQAFLPALPAQAVTSLLSMHLPAEGLPRMLTILIVGYAQSSVRQSPAAQDHVRALRVLSTVAQQQAEMHSAIVERFGDMLLFAFGAFDERPLTTTLRSALQTAQALRQSWDRTSPRGALALSIASGTGLAAALPGLGYTVIGAPIEQALRLQYLAAACPEYALLCSEESYLNLRRLDTTTWLPTDLRLLEPDQPPQVVYALPF